MPSPPFEPRNNAMSCEGCGNTDKTLFRPFTVSESAKVVRHGRRCLMCSRVELEEST